PTTDAAVRDSKNPDGAALAIPRPAWSSFITSVR
ncbi:DUF397 domain-containing protein, partial [Streptomyces sp. UNOC14_S4]|nr:DUF397 domain-containing protein [Streptomyces sp. UNOC14_S4]